MLSLAIVAQLALEFGLPQEKLIGWLAARGWKAVTRIVNGVKARVFVNESGEYLGRKALRGIAEVGDDEVIRAIRSCPTHFARKEGGIPIWVWRNYQHLKDHYKTLRNPTASEWDKQQAEEFISQIIAQMREYYQNPKWLPPSSVLGTGRR